MHSVAGCSEAGNVTMASFLDEQEIVSMQKQRENQEKSNHNGPDQHKAAIEK
jgi:hypothetical protein